MESRHRGHGDGNAASLGTQVPTGCPGRGSPRGAPTWQEAAPPSVSFPQHDHFCRQPPSANREFHFLNHPELCALGLSLRTLEKPCGGLCSRCPAQHSPQGAWARGVPAEGHDEGIKACGHYKSLSSPRKDPQAGAHALVGDGPPAPKSSCQSRLAYLSTAGHGASWLRSPAWGRAGGFVRWWVPSP